MATTSKQPSAPIDPRPTHSAQPKPLMKVAIQEVVAVNFLVPPDILKKHIPKGLELDYFGGETYVSLNCMVVRKLGLMGIPLAPSCSYLNLRFYVRRTDDPLRRRGSCSIRNYVSSSTAAWLLGSRLEGSFEKMKIKNQNSGFLAKTSIPEAQYQWKVGDHWNKLRTRGRSPVKNTGLKTNIGFILDHANIYKTIKGKTHEFQVQHPQWRIWSVAQANFTCDVERLFGKPFVKPLARRPSSVFISPGSDVTFFKPQQI